MFFSFSLDCLKMHPWRDRCLGKVQIYVHWSGFTWYNFRLMKSGWSRLCLHQHFSCRQQCGFAVNPVSMQYWCWGLSTKTALFWSAPLSRGYLDIFSNADTAQLLAGRTKPPLWAAERNKRQIICFIWDRRLRTRWMKNTIKQLRCTQWTLVSWVKRVNPAPRVQFYIHSATGEELAPDHVVHRRNYGAALCDRRGHDPQGNSCSASHPGIPCTTLIQAWGRTCWTECSWEQESCSQFLAL